MGTIAKLIFHTRVFAPRPTKEFGLGLAVARRPRPPSRSALRCAPPSAAPRGAVAALFDDALNLDAPLRYAAARCSCCSMPLLRHATARRGRLHFSMDNADCCRSTLSLDTADRRRWRRTRALHLSRGTSIRRTILLLQAPLQSLREARHSAQGFRISNDRGAPRRACMPRSVVIDHWDQVNSQVELSFR